PSGASAVASTAISGRLKSKNAESAAKNEGSPAHAGPAAGSEAVTHPIRPLRASDVHDSRVRRITTITPDMVCPKPHDPSPRPIECPQDDDRLAIRSCVH